jgi:prolyl-tRNA synthetase
MRASRFFLPTLRNAPSEAELRSHSLLVRGGFIKRQAAGVYTYLPLGLRVMTKVANIVRDEANAAGAVEMLMPTLVPFELLQETGRDKVEVLYKTTDRTGRDFALGFTHEEVLTDVVRTFVSSYRQMPLCLYQIQTKFRDEPRPRAGLIRGKEFSMFDAYSFDTNQEDVDDV